jgi:hypothetical protein
MDPASTWRTSLEIVTQLVGGNINPDLNLAVVKDMARTANPVKTTISLEPETVEYLDGIAKSFEDYVARGELVDMMAAYIAEKELEDDVFGSEDDGDEDDGDKENESEPEEREAD